MSAILKGPICPTCGGGGAIWNVCRPCVEQTEKENIQLQHKLKAVTSAMLQWADELDTAAKREPLAAFIAIEIRNRLAALDAEGE